MNSSTAHLSKLFNYRSLTEPELKHYHEEGYLVIPAILTSAGLAGMEAECMAAWKAEKGEYDPDANWLKNALLPNIHHRSKIVRDYYFEGPLVGIAAQIIGPNVKGATSQLTFKMRGNTKPFAWHQDNGYGELSPYNAITCLTALENNDKETGCLWIIPRSHALRQIERGLSSEDVKMKREIVIKADETKAVPMPMKAGDCLIFSCWTLHKSEGNFSTDRDRRVLFLRYADADAIEVANDGRPRLGRVVKGTSKFGEVAAFEQNL